MSNNWVDVCIQTELDAGELLSLLDDPAVQGAWEEPGTVHLYWACEQWNGDRLASVRAALAQLGPAQAESPLLVNRIPGQDWNEQWARSVKPLKIGRLVIRPSWEPVSLGPGELEIVLDPKQAFGTGHHATTRMLLEWLQERVHPGERVLDVGTGSGILAMAAVKLGATSAIGVECDPVAVDCAGEYVAANGMTERIELVCGTLDDVSPQPDVSLVLANIDRQTLLRLAGDLARYAEAGARLVLSGLLADQEAEILERFGSFGLACFKRRELDGWMALELVKPDSCEGGSW